MIVALGATAAGALVAPSVRVLRDRGAPIASLLATALFVTVHPSALLRAPDERAREEGFAGLVTDLRLALAHASRA